MKTEPTSIIELVRAIALILSFFGVVITLEDQAVIAAGIAAFALLASAGLAWWNRNRVFSPATTERLVQRAATTGIPVVGDPPAG